MKYFKKLVGERIFLSPMAMGDCEKFVEWMNDFGVTDYIGRTAQVLTVAGEMEFLENAKDKEATFCIVANENGKEKLIGSISINDINHIHRMGTLGIFIGDSEYRSKGYGAEAINLILEFAFRYMNLNNINLSVYEYNARAIKCYTKVGFKEYGRRRKCIFMNGKYYDRVYMDILAEEFTGDFIKNKEVK